MRNSLGHPHKYGVWLQSRNVGGSAFAFMYDAVPPILHSVRLKPLYQANSRLYLRVSKYISIMCFDTGMDSLSDFLALVLLRVMPCRVYLNFIFYCLYYQGWGGCQNTKGPPIEFADFLHYNRKSLQSIQGEIREWPE